jgi:hypothetical protein
VSGCAGCINLAGDAELVYHRREALPMKLRLLSDQFDVLEGRVMQFGWANRSDSDFPQVRHNLTDEIQAPATGPISFVCTQCRVRDRRTAREHRIAGMHVVGTIGAVDREQRIADVIVQPCSFAQVDAVDAVGRRPAEGQVIGIALPHASFEAFAGDHPLSLLLPAGEYTAYVTGSRPVTTTFVVDGTTDVATIRLRLSE